MYLSVPRENQILQMPNGNAFITLHANADQKKEQIDPAIEIYIPKQQSAIFKSVLGSAIFQNLS
jgi:hypothetical protein